MTPGHDVLLAGVDDASLQALIEGRHGDPFAILGPHLAGGGSIVRAFMPGATGPSTYFCVPCPLASLRTRNPA